jgi:hypothetical protein
MSTLRSEESVLQKEPRMSEEPISPPTLPVEPPAPFPPVTPIEPAAPQPKNSNTTLIIILVVAGVLLICCCCVILAALAFFANSGTVFSNIIQGLGTPVP